MIAVIKRLLLLVDRGRLEALDGYRHFLNPVASFRLNGPPSARIRNRPRDIHQTNLVGLNFKSSLAISFHQIKTPS